MLNKLKIVFLAVFLFLISANFSKAEGAFFKFEPSNVNTSSGNNFEIKIILDPANDQITSTDIYINYDSSFLKPINVKSENLFPVVGNNLSASGKIYISGTPNDSTFSISSAGAVATITFQALKGGSTNLTFDCNESTIVKKDENATNVLNCNQNNSALIDIGGGGSSSSNNQNQPLSGQSQSNNNPPQSLPKAGIIDDLLKISLPGLSLLLFGLFLKFNF